MAISKGRRFDIFRRDSFTCQYCGQRPPDVVLELDHVHPRSKGGTDDEMNLITACAGCNGGKSAKVLGESVPKPDADLEFLAIQQEMAELRRYLAAKEERDAIMSDIERVLDQVWAEFITPYSLPREHTVKGWLATNTPEEVEQAIKITAPKYHGGYIEHNVLAAVKYVWGVLNRMRAEREG